MRCNWHHRPDHHWLHLLGKLKDLEKNLAQYIDKPLYVKVNICKREITLCQCNVRLFRLDGAHTSAIPLTFMKLFPIYTVWQQNRIPNLFFYGTRTIIDSCILTERTNWSTLHFSSTNPDLSCPSVVPSLGSLWFSLVFIVFIHFCSVQLAIDTAELFWEDTPLMGVINLHLLWHTQF